MFDSDTYFTPDGYIAVADGEEMLFATEDDHLG